MQQIRPWLHVGKYRDTLDPDRLRQYGIDAMLQLAEAVEQPGVSSLYLPMEDGRPIPPESLRQGVDFALTKRAQRHTVLIACGAGISRSVALAIAVLKEAEGLPLFEAWLEVKKRHPEAMPHLALWESLTLYYHENVPFLRLLGEES
jgi:protein-tyrosine phosphatase